MFKILFIYTIYYVKSISQFSNVQVNARCTHAAQCRENGARIREIVVGGDGGDRGGGGRRKTTENKAAEESRRRKKNEGAVSWWKLF